MEQIFGKWGVAMTDAERATALAVRAENWMLDAAFPFWAERTPNPDGGFYERLDLQGRGISGEDSRVRLQARMGFTFALAADLGWNRNRCLDLTDRAIDVLVQDCRRDDGLYGRMVQPGKGLTDETAEAYDTAFALLAFATAYQVFGLASARKAGEELSRAIDNVLIRPEAQGGYKEQLPAPTIRGQNPHMHLTEASLAWFDATKDPAALKRAETLAAFVQQRFYRDDLGLLVEFDGADDSSNRAEVGHMFEWVWILGRLRELGGTVPTGFADALHTGAMRLLDGLDYLPLSQALDGTVLEEKQRTWGPTEKLKGNIALWRINRSDGLVTAILDTAEKLFADHVEGAIPGAWIDSIAPDRSPLIKDITPATGYHIFLAFQELMNFAGELRANSTD